MSTAIARSSALQSPAPLTREDVRFRPPRSTDGMEVHRLIRRCHPLDENSPYCNLLQASHFRDTSVAAECPDGNLLGFVSGYLVPDRDDTLFIWQVAVSPDARGLGLGKRMMKDILMRPGHDQLSYLHTTITPDNDASWGMFRSLARDLEATVDTTVMFASDVHFDGEHDDEVLMQIGPFDLAE